jgi:hypothetical protein
MRFPRARSQKAVPPIHTSSPRGHSAWVRTVVRVVVASALMSRVVTLTTGCGPKDGDEGGRCIHNGGCDSGAHCNSANLSCGYDDICHATSSSPPVDARSPCDLLISQARCGGPTFCRDSARPDPAWNGACAVAASDEKGNTVFCCDESKPVCFGDGLLAASPAGVLNWSDCPGEGFGCHGMPIPNLPDASYQCAVGPTDDAGHTGSCCVSGDACFLLGAMDWASPNAGYYPQGACAPGEEQYFCTGSAMLPDGPCHPMPMPDGGDPHLARSSCCPSGYFVSADAGMGDANDGGTD